MRTLCADPEAFRARISTLTLGSMRLIRSETTAHRGWWQGPDETERDTVGFVILVKGTVRISEHPDPMGIRLLRRGDLVSYIADTSIRTLTLAIPLVAFDHRAARVLRTGDGALASSSATVRAVTTLVESAFRHDEIDIGEVHHLERAILGLLESVVIENIARTPTVPSVDDVMYARAEAAIARRCAEPELGPEQIAAEVAATVRTLQRLFQSRGTSVSAEIRSHRLTQLAAMIVAEPDHRTLAELAVDVGFAGQDQAIRAFRKRFGVSMREYRRLHAAP